LLFDKQAWAETNNHHDQRLPGFIIEQEPEHGQISYPELGVCAAAQARTRQTRVYAEQGILRRSFLAFGLWQSGEPFLIYCYYKLLLE
jgi:hypothetical protein